MSVADSMYRFLRWTVRTLVDPLRIDDDMHQFTLAIPEAQTTTVDSVQGWSNRPPAVLECPGCGAAIAQRRARIDIDCPECHRTFKPHDFSKLELLELTCPRCETAMDHGTRHPNVFDIPEWATCRECQYHWDLDHWFRMAAR